MKEAVELVEAVEETGKIYAYGENYCFFGAPHEMRKLDKEGKIGEFEYGEGEYIHNCEPCWPEIAYGDPNHWRNNMYATFYCTHSLGPIIHITGLRPVSVVGFEGQKTERNLRDGSKSGQFGIEMVTLENGGIIKSIHGGLYKGSVWYSLYGSKGRMESGREDIIALDGYKSNNVYEARDRIFVHTDEYSGAYDTGKIDTYMTMKNTTGTMAGHGGSDYWTMWNFVERIKGNKDTDVIDVYEAWICFYRGCLHTVQYLRAVYLLKFRIFAIKKKGKNGETTWLVRARKWQAINLYLLTQRAIPK